MFDLYVTFGYVCLPRETLAIRAAASTRVLDFTTRVLVNFYFRLQISISGCNFLQSKDELLEFMQTWGFAISFATCQPGNRSECIHGGSATQPAAGLQPKSSAQRYGTIDATSAFLGDRL